MRLLALAAVLVIFSALPGVTPFGWQWIPDVALLVAAVASFHQRRGAVVLTVVFAGLASGVCSGDPIAFKPFVCLVAVLAGQLFWARRWSRGRLLPTAMIVMIALLFEWSWRVLGLGGVELPGSLGDQVTHAGVTLLLCPIAVATFESKSP